MHHARALLIASTVIGASGFMWVWAACGQSGKRFEGKILDPSGGGMAGADVILYSDDRVHTEKADSNGNVVFVGLTSPARYLEAFSAGFRPGSISIPQDARGAVSLILDVGSCTQCTPFVDVRDRSVHYEERSGREQLSGSVREFSGPILPVTSIDLMRAGQETTLPEYRNPAMARRTFKYTFVAHVVSNDQGEFEFSSLDPGWYSLEATHDGYQKETARFWIARETLTRPSRIEMVRTRPGGASPIRPASDVIPLEQAPLPDLPLTPPRH